ncbi:MAG: hypothetical protein PQJ58_15360 [Spirochaetales bacterium]|nr:hypothetical protein [Spirochaetales bacterium]
MELDQFCSHDYDQHRVNLYLRFTGNFLQYAKLNENEIPDHPLLNRHWDLMEEYMIYSIKDYITPHLLQNFKKISANTSFTQCWNQLVYLQTRFPALEEEEPFLICRNLADSYKAIRKEEYDSRVSFFQHSDY